MIAGCAWASSLRRNSPSLESARKMPDLPLPQQMADNAILVEDLSDPNKLFNLAEAYRGAASGSLGNASSNLKFGVDF